MNEEKIKKLEEYKKLIIELDNKITRNTFMLFIGILVITFSFHNDELTDDGIKYLISILGSGISVVYLKRIIENIVKKTNIENIIEILDFNESLIKKLK